MSTELALRPAQEPSLFNIATLLEANDFSLQMSKAKLIPAHLQNSPSDCLRVVMQAAKWGMDPFAVADKTSVISNKLMYEGQLVAAVINTRANLAKRLSYTFSGTAAQRLLVVSGTPRGETEPLTIELTYSQACAINKNGQMQKNPDQQMCYIGARIWARRHMPELMLGVTSADEIPEDQELTNVTGTGDAPVADPVPQRQAPPPRSRKGAAAVQENVTKQEPVTEVVATAVENPASPAPSQPAPVAAPAPVAVATITPEVVATPEPAKATASRTTLNDAEELTATCTVISANGMLMKSQGKLSPGVRVELEGGFKGTVYHSGGGIADRDINDKDVNVTPIPAWTVGGTVSVKLVGKLPAGGKTTLIRVLEVAPTGAEVDLG